MTSQPIKSDPEALAALRGQAEMLTGVLEATVGRPKKRALQPRAFHSVDDAEYVERELGGAVEMIQMAANDYLNDAEVMLKEFAANYRGPIKDEVLRILEHLQEVKRTSDLAYWVSLASDYIKAGPEESYPGNAPSRGEYERGNNQGEV